MEVDVEMEPMPLAIVDRLAEVAVLSDDIPVLSEPMPLVTVDRAVLVDVLSDDMPVLADVDSDATLLSVVESPVESEPMPLVTVDRPVLVDALSEEMPVDADVLNEDKPVESDDTPVLRLETAVDVEVESVSIAVLVANSCEPLIASVLSDVTWPAATFVI